MQRREFLIASSMSAALSLASRAAAGIVGSGAPSSGGVLVGSGRAPAGEGHAPVEIQALVYEPRYLAACELARQQVARGVVAFAANGCMVGLWRGPLATLLNRGELRLRQESQGPHARVAGLTLYSDFQIARECGRERGFRVLHEEWCRDGSVALVSWLLGT